MAMLSLHDAHKYLIVEFNRVPPESTSGVGFVNLLRF